MRFLLTLNMPSAQGFLVHQLTVEHPSESCGEFCDYLNDNEFIIVDLLYRHKNNLGDITWSEKGEIILNTNHIGKVQEFIGVEKDEEYEAQRHTDNRTGYVDGKRPALRPSGRYPR
jgi:hypothetical protein